jgi:NAD(P)-dependent dehydrogenase (short-subunit alcohol dehydrogenase family)
MQKGRPKRKARNERRQARPGKEAELKQAPQFESDSAAPGKKLQDKAVLITGGDSGIGRAVAVLFARHGADIALTYLKPEAEDAALTKSYVEAYGRKCILIPGDISSERHCKRVVSVTVKSLGRLDVLINNAGLHYKAKSILDISSAQLKRTFEVNVFAMFYLVKEALPHLRKGSSIINTASVTAYRGSSNLIDYSATKGAIVSFTRALSASLVEKQIRVNAVAPGPIWTPLIASSMKPKEINTFGTDSPMGRVGQPAEVAPAYLYLASDESSYVTGQVLHVNGGEIVNG